MFSAVELGGLGVAASLSIFRSLLLTSRSIWLVWYVPQKVQGAREISGPSMEQAVMHLGPTVKYDLVGTQGSRISLQMALAVVWGHVWFRL